MTAMKTAPLTKEQFLQHMEEGYDKAAEKGTADQYTAHMLAASVSFNQPAPEVLAPVDTAVIGETDGSETLAQAEDVFTGHIDSDLKSWETDKPSKATTALPVTILELHKDATNKEIFAPPPGRTLDDLCIPQSQIKKFCKESPRKLRQDGYATLFLFKVGDKYFVAYVLVYAHGLKVSVLRFGYPGTWRAGLRYCVVVPQLQA